MHRSYNKIHVIADSSPNAQAAKRSIIKKYKNYSINDSDVFIILGGDGFMLASFKKYTKKHSLQKNINQEDLIKTLDTLTEQLKPSFLKSVTSIFSSKKPKGFYLYGDVGAGKTMIVNFFLEYLNHNTKCYCNHR